MDDLVRLIELGPVNRGPQCRVARNELLPGFTEGREVELAPNSAEELLDVVSGIGVDQGVEEHTFLDRGKGIRVLDSPAAGEGALDRIAVNSTGRSAQTERHCASTILGRLIRARRSPRPLSQARRWSGAGTGARVQGPVGLPRPRDNLDAHDGVDAKLEQVVVDADAAPSHEFRHDRGKDLLRGGARGAYSVCGP